MDYGPRWPASLSLIIRLAKSDAKDTRFCVVNKHVLGHVVHLNGHEARWVLTEDGLALLRTAT